MSTQGLMFLQCYRRGSGGSEQLGSGGLGARRVLPCLLLGGSVEGQVVREQKAPCAVRVDFRGHFCLFTCSVASQAFYLYPLLSIPSQK